MKTLEGEQSVSFEISVHLIQRSDIGENDGIATLVSSLGTEGPMLLVDRDAIASEVHLRSSLMHAARSILRGRCRARDRYLEVLRYLSGSRQVGEGLTLSGPGQDTRYLIVITFPAEWPREEDAMGLPTIRRGKASEIRISDPRLELLDDPGDDILWGGIRSRKFKQADAELKDGDPHLAILERTAMADQR